MDHVYEAFRAVIENASLNEILTNGNLLIKELSKFPEFRIKDFYITRKIGIEAGRSGLGLHEENAILDNNIDPPFKDEQLRKYYKHLLHKISELYYCITLFGRENNLRQHYMITD